MSKINVQRTTRIRKKSDQELAEIVRSGSLSAAAANYELDRREVKAQSARQ